MTARDFALPQRRAASATLRRSGVFWLALAGIGMVAFFWTGLVSLRDAWSRPEYSHGYLIPLIALYLLLVRLDDRQAGTARDAWSAWGLSVVGLGLVVGLLGNLSSISEVTTYGLIICVAGLVLSAACFGRGITRWVPVVYLVFMLPLPQFLYWPLSIKLQLISSEIGVAIVSLAGVPVYLEGNIIDLGTYQLQVTEACNGLRYLFPLMSFGFLFAALYKGPIWHKPIIFLAVLPITILMNAFRVGVTGLLVDRYGIAQAEGFLHFFEGWIVFLACLGILYCVGVVLQRTTRRPQPIYAMVEADVATLGRQLISLRELQASRALIAGATAILVAGFVWQLAPARADITPGRTPLILFSTKVGDWEGKRRALEPTIERVLGADDYLVTDFANAAAAAPVNLFIAYYDTQIAKSSIHSPQNCLPIGGWEVSRWTRHDTGLSSASGRPLRVNRAVIQKGVRRQLVYYWFEQRGRALTSEYAAKAHTLIDSITQSRTDGALVRVVTPIEASEAPGDADKRLGGFLKLALTKLPAHLPE